MEIVLLVTFGSSVALAGWSALSIFRMGSGEQPPEFTAAEGIRSAFASEMEKLLGNPRLPPELFEFMHRFWISVDDEQTAPVYFSTVQVEALQLQSVGGIRLERSLRLLENSDLDTAEQVMCCVRLGLMSFFLRWSELSGPVLESLNGMPSIREKELQVAFDICAAGAVEIHDLQAA